VATESDLRDLLRDPDPEGRPTIDLDAVLTRARRRRRPKVVAAQALGSVAAVGALFVGIPAIVPPPQSATMVAGDSDGGAEVYDAGAAEEFDAGPTASDYALRISAETCGAAFEDTVATSTWTLAIEPLAADEGFAELTVPVTLRNDGTTAVTGVASVPRIVLTLDGVVVGYAPAVDLIGIPVDLAPKASVGFEATVEPYACDPADPQAPLDELGLLPPGDYEMRPVVQFAGEDGTVDAIAGPPQPLVIR
jgi:hypothetical protein